MKAKTMTGMSKTDRAMRSLKGLLSDELPARFLLRHRAYYSQQFPKPTIVRWEVAGTKIWVELILRREAPPVISCGLEEASPLEVCVAIRLYQDVATFAGAFQLVWGELSGEELTGK